MPSYKKGPGGLYWCSCGVGFKNVFIFKTHLNNNKGHEPEFK
jgi:hypothetical protein